VISTPLDFFIDDPDFDEEPKQPWADSLVYKALFQLLADVNHVSDHVAIIYARNEHGRFLEPNEYRSETLEASVFYLSTVDIDTDLDDGRVSTWYNGQFIDIYHNDRGKDIMVTHEALDILSLATNGRMTPARVWRMAMHQGKPLCWEFEQINYGPVEEYQGIFWADLTPGFNNIAPRFSGMVRLGCEGLKKKLPELELLNDVELIRQAIIWEGKFWVWMAPHEFPLSELPHDNSIIPGVLNRPTYFCAPSKFEQLPSEIFVDIASRCTLSSLLSLVSTSHHIRFTHLAFLSDRDILARAWIRMSAPWYEVNFPTKPPNQRSDWRLWMGWSYLTRCLSSPSMRNRRRIWDIAEQLERRANEIGI
jgi:hypothetical protein